MKCKKIFALLLSLCMIASLFVAMPVSAATENVIDIDLPLDDASELTWVQSGVTVSNADGIGGRDDVVLAEGLANSNSNTVGVKLPDGFAFADGDILTYSLDVYSETAINPDMWLRNHQGSLSPFATLYESEIAASTWTTITKTFTFAELEAKIAASGSSGSFTTTGNYAFYLRPRSNATVYLDNLKLTVSRPIVERGNIIDITVDTASDITWTNGGTAADVNGIGGRDGVIELGNLANANGNTAGVVLADSFAFAEGDILTYSLDVYSTVAHPDLWLRNHGSSLNPFTTFYHEVTPNTWTTITKTVNYAELIAVGAFNNADKYALYIRPRETGTVYVDNFTVTVARVGYDPEHVHEYGDWETDGDENHKKECACGDIVTEAHAWDEGVVTQEPTTSAEGVKTYTCTECGATKTEAIDKIVNREIVIDINASLNTVSELTWVASSAVTVTEADGVGGRDDVLKVEGLANSNSNTAGIKLPDGFAFQEGDILTYSVDVYSDSAINPDMWLRNHNDSVLNPLAIFYHTATAGQWTTITKTVTFEELEAAITAANSSGSFATSGNYALYIRPRSNATVYVDNFTVTVSRPVVERGNVIDIAVDTASDITWLGANSSATATDADGIGGRDGVIALGNLAYSNDNTAGVVLGDSFAFAEGDILTYSFDVYSDSITNPDIWLRNHGSSLDPLTTFYHTATTGGWTTITKTVAYADLIAAGAFNNADKYALYIRPRNGQSGTVYVDNFTVTVSRALTGKPTLEKTVDYVTLEDGVFTATTAGIATTEASGAWSSQVRLRIIPELPVSINDDLKISFDFEAAGILNSQGNPYSEMIVNLRLYDSVDGTTQGNTIGYIKNEHVAANTGLPVTVEYYIEDMENGGGLSSLTEVKSIGVQVDMYGACTQYNNAANDGYYTISNVKVENVEKPEAPHEHEYVEEITTPATCEEAGVKTFTCECGDSYTEAIEALGHTWDEGVVTQEPTVDAEGVKTYTCTVCGDTYTEAIEKLPAPSVAIGDANEDGEVDVGDVTFMRQDIAGGYGVKVNETAADVNKDGTFDVGDVTHLRQFIAGGYGIVLQ